jgi:acetyl esterase/lipase
MMVVVPNRRFTAKRGNLFQAIVVAMALATAGCNRFDALNSLVPTSGYHCIADVPYGPSARQKLDIYQPEKFTAPAGVVIFFYGGDWQFGSKHDYRFVGQALSSRGFIAVLPDYRLYPEVAFPGFVEDGALAIRWVHDHAAHFGGDPRAIFLMGHSAGAHIAALLTLDDEYLHAVGLDRGAICATAGLSGPYDFTPYEGDLAVFGMKPGDAPPPAMEPIHFVDGHEPPMLLVTGTTDYTVDSGNTARLACRIQEAGGKVKTIYYCGRGHVGVVMSLAYPFRWLAPTLRDVTEYFREMMKSATE